MSRASIAIDTPKGSRAFHYRTGTSDEKVIEQIFHIREYAFLRFKQGDALLRMCNREAKRGRYPLIVDAGANIGAASVYFSILFPRAQIVAIEPSSENCELLAQNTEGLKVEIIQGALASRPGHVELMDPGVEFWSFQTTPVSDTATASSVPAVALNEIFAQHADRCFPLMVKLDIEGAERDVFSDRLEWIDQTPVIGMELHDWLFPGKATARPFLQAVAHRDRDFMILGENVFSVRWEESREE